MINDLERQAASRELAPAIEQLYIDPNSGATMAAVFDRSTLSIDNYERYAQMIGDTILGFYHTKNLPQQLQKELGLSADEAQKIVSELAEFLSPVLEREAAAENAKKTELQGLSEQFSNKPATPTPPIATQPATNTDGEEAIQATGDTPEEAAAPGGGVHEVLPMRTMQGDMKRIHGYGAYRQANPVENTQTEEPVYRSEQPTPGPRTPLAETPRIEE